MAIQWNDVRANFNDANSAMGNAQRGLSQAGTVFGELRKAILDEEQKAIENEYRQKVFDENVRQFGLQHALDQDKFAEQQLQNKIANEYNDRKLEQEWKIAEGGWNNARQLQQMRINADNANRNRDSNAIVASRQAYEDSRKNGQSPLEAANNASKVYYSYSPSKNFTVDMLPQSAQYDLTPANLAKVEFEKSLNAGIAQKNLKGAESLTNTYDSFMNNIVTVDGEVLLKDDKASNGLRTLTPEEQQIYNNITTLAYADKVEQSRNDIVNLRNNLNNTNYTPEQLKSFSDASMTATGVSSMLDRAARMYGTSPEYVGLPEVIRNAQREQETIKAADTRKAEQLAAEATDKNPSTVTKITNDFLSNTIKYSNGDGGSNTIAIPEKVRQRVLANSEKAKQLGIKASDFQTYLNLLKQDVIANQDWKIDDYDISDDYFNKLIKGDTNIITQSVSNNSNNSDNSNTRLSSSTKTEDNTKDIIENLKKERDKYKSAIKRMTTVTGEVNIDSKYRFRNAEKIVADYKDRLEEIEKRLKELE